MRLRSILLLGSLSTLATGCSVDVLHYGARNLIYAPCSRINGCKECVNANAVAEDSWRKFRKQNANVAYSEDFADGYIWGFADYVEKGGNGNPPVAPPYRYRKVRYETPEGHQRITDWFAGCRTGAAAAQASGYRELVIMPLAVPPPSPTPAQMMYSSGGMGGYPEQMLPAPAPLPAPEPEHLQPPTPVPEPVRPPAPAEPQGNLTPPDQRPAVIPGPQASAPPHALPQPPAPSVTPSPQPARLNALAPWEEETPEATTAPMFTSGSVSVLEETKPASANASTPESVDRGVWAAARAAQDGSTTSSVAPAEKAPVADGVPASAAVLRPSPAPRPAPSVGKNPDDPGVIVSHRGARWQN